MREPLRAASECNAALVPAGDTEPSETAEKVPASIRRPVSRQLICLDRWSEGRSATVWRSRFCADRIAGGEVDFFGDGLVEKEYFSDGARGSRRRPEART